MKHPTINAMILGVGLSALSVKAADAVIVEVPINKVFIAKTGFDDNDSVEAVIDGVLPNTCYAVENQTLRFDKITNTFEIKQYAIRLGSGTCKEGSSPGNPEFMTPIPYSQTLSLGRLKRGDYQIQFINEAGENRIRHFGVAVAPVPSVDDALYAYVSTVQVLDMHNINENVVAQVSGILNNSCYELGPVTFERLDDVVVILPTIVVTKSDACLMMTRNFTLKVNLGRMPTEDRYLIHVRSMHGKSVNHVFTVTRNPVLKESALSPRAL